MATLAANSLTLVDVAKRLDPDGTVGDIAELLSQSNEILLDMPWKEGNLPTGHRITLRTALPTGTWRKFNEGVASTKSTTVQVDEACGMYEQRGKIDKDLAMLNGNTPAFRLSENKAHLASMNNDMASALVYSDSTSDPAKILGLTPRYNAISGATSGQNVISGAGAGSDNTSIWLLGWSPDTIYGIYPKGSKAGLQHTPITDGSGDGCADALDAAGNPYRALIDHYQWKCGLAIEDWRYAVRFCNIDVSNLVANTSAADLIETMSRMIDRLPTKSGIKPAFYMNRTAKSILKLQAARKSANAVTWGSAANQFTDEFLGIPIRTCDAILNTEATVS